MTSIKNLFKILRFLSIFLLLCDIPVVNGKGPAKQCICGATSLGGMSGAVTSPNYPQFYGSNCRCTYFITVPSPYRVLLHFTIVDFAGGCSQDYLRVTDRQTRVQLTRLCSTQRAPTTVTSQGQGVVLYFVSDRRNTARGFRATYTAVAPTTIAVTTPVTTHISSTTYTTTSQVPTTTMSLAPSTTSSTRVSYTTTGVAQPTTSVNSTLTTKSVFPDSNTSIEKITTEISTTLSTADNTSLTNDVQARSSIHKYAWMIPIIVVAVLLLLVIVIIVVCYVGKRSSAKSRYENNVPLNNLNTNDPTVIVNHTYQSANDLIGLQDTVYQPIEEVTTQPEYGDHSNMNIAIYSNPVAVTETPIYYTTDNTNVQRKNSSHKYTKVTKDHYVENHMYQTADGETENPVYQYTDLTRPVSADYQYADQATPTYEYAEATSQMRPSDTPTLRVADKHVMNEPGNTTYETLDPVQWMDKCKTTLSDDRNKPTESKSQYMEYNTTEKHAYQTLSDEARMEVDVVQPSIGDEGVYLAPNSPQDGRKDSGCYDLVNTEAGYQSLDNADSDIVSDMANDPYDVVDVSSMRNGQMALGNEQMSNIGYVTNETYEDLNIQVDKPASDNVGYTEYNAKEEGQYQDLVPEENPLFGSKQ